MKKTYIYKCNHCGFETNEYNKKCPLCGNETTKIEHAKLNINPTLPERLNNNNNSRNVKMNYHCFKCKKDTLNKVCLDCNNVASLQIEYNNKKAIIKRINCLNEVFTNEEVTEILKELTEEEKNYIYFNYQDAYRFFYKKDKTKAIVCFLFSAIFYGLFLDIALNMSDETYYFMTYFFNCIGNFIFVVMGALGFWYLKDATVVEFEKVPAKLAIVVGIPNILNLAYLIVKDCKIKETLISGWITLVLSIIIYIIYVLVDKHHEK